MKKLLSIMLVVIMALSVIPMGGIVDASAASFTPRTTEPSNTNKYYLHTSAGGVNECIVRSGGSVLPNCVGYAWGRAYEILGAKPKLAKTNANTWYGYNKNNGYYSYGSTPKLGAIMCWAHGSAGHVAVVEKIEGNKITISESHYSGVRFDIKTGTQSQIEGYLNSFQGYIYIGNFDTAPVITSANGDNHTEVTIKWSEVSKATKYTLERRKAGDSSYSTVKSSITGTSYTDTGLNKNQRYYYKVTAYNGSTKLGTSEAVGVYTKFDPPSITTVSDSKLKITWDSVAKAESYTIMRKKAGEEYSEIKTVTDTSYTDSGLSASTQYYYWIKANCNVDGTSLVAKSTSSNRYTFTKAPVIKEIDDISTSEVKVIWNAVSGASSYRIERRKAGDSDYTTIKSDLTDTFYNDTGLESGCRYYYIVYAKNSSGESAGSEAMGGYTKYDILNVTSVNTYQLDLSWYNIGYAENYTIRRKVYNGEYEIINKTTETSYADIGLQSGTEYRYWIQADCNVNGTNLVAKTVSQSQYTLMERPDVLAPSSTSVTLEWYEVRGNSTYKYEVLRSAVGENNFKVIATTTSTIYTDNSLSPSNEYVYRIKAYDSNSNYCTETFEPVWVGTSACFHNYTSTTVFPTCTEVGTITYTCTICGGNYSETIPETGHFESVVQGYDSTCKDTGLTESVHCTVCNEILKEAVVIGAKGHTAEDNWVTVSSFDGKIVQVKYCSRCKDVVETREIVDDSKATDPTEIVTENTKSTETTVTDSTETTVATETIITVTTNPVDKPSDTVGTDPTETVVIDPTETTEVTEAVTGEPVDSSATEQESSSMKDNETKPGESESGKCLLGDVNCDGKVNIKDATTIQKYLANMIDLDEIQLFVADTDQNGKVNIKDATVLQKFLAGFVLDVPINTYIDVANGKDETTSSACNIEETDSVQNSTTSISSNDEPTTSATSDEADGKDEVSTNPNDNNSSNDEETSVPNDLVTEVYSYYYSKGDRSYEYHIPKINLNDSKMELINEEIWEWCYETSLKDQIKNIETAGGVYFLDMNYEWAVNGDILSLCISKSFNGGKCYYKIYNISITTCDVLTDDEVINQAGYTYEKYFDRLKDVMASAYLDYNRVDENTDLERYITIHGDKIIGTLSDDNLRKTRVYLNDKGELCIVGIRKSAAGADEYLVMYNIDIYEVNQYYLDIVNNMILK